jgi:mannose-6-phosphate isomerase-like protein (cupin superfamily)
MSKRPIGEVYTPPADHLLLAIVPNEHYRAWNYDIARELDAEENEVPEGGNTTIFSLHPDGMTEPVYVTKPTYTASFSVSVTAGEGRLIRGLPDGSAETVELDPGTLVTIKPGQAYSYVNTGEDNLVLHDMAVPAFEPGDDAQLNVSLRPEGKISKARPTSSYCIIKDLDGKPRELILSNRFWDLIGQAAAGRLGPDSTM